LENTAGAPIAPPAGGVISGLTVYLVDVDTDSGLVWRSETDEAGAFRFESVRFGRSYELQVVSGGAAVINPMSVAVSESGTDSLVVPLLFEEGQIVVARETMTLESDSVRTTPYLSEIRIAVAVSGEDSRETVVVDSIAYDGDSAHVTVYQTVIPGPDGQQAGWRFGFGAGLASLNTGGFSFFVPAITLLGNYSEEWYVSGMLGWRPKTITADSVYTGDTGDRAEAIAAVQISRYFTRTWGAAAGIQAAWESIPEFDEFIKRAVGLTLGGRARVRVVPRRVEAVFSFDFQLSNLSEFGTSGERTFAPGLAAGVTINYVFR
jgi:hypothetical protein